MPEALIRAARPEDAPLIVDFQLRMARETEDLELDLATVTAGVEAVFADPRKAAYYVAERDGQIVGGLMTTFEWSDWRNGVILWIQSVYVIAEERGRGIYRALYEHLKRRVEEDPGLKGIRLYVDKRNAAAQAVYERLGMSREHYDTFEWLKP
ncbi:MAG TPA: GNAT family N-acetyltransferase [Thermoanaerobaculia bacterium]|nr:GNAT family N-acetyltransferase [Thermoanaerobaculia bacterium]